MSTQVQIRRGTTAQHSTFTGAVGELTVDTDKKVVVVQDGTTPGGNPLADARTLKSAYDLANSLSTIESAAFGVANNAYDRANGSAQLTYYNYVINGVTINPASNADTLVIRSSNNIVLLANSVNDSIQITQNPSGVTANTYGGVNTIPIFVVDQYGRITSSQNVAVSAGATIGNTAPPSPLVGALWWNSTYGRMFVYYSDADSSQWVDATPSYNIGPLYDLTNSAYSSANAVGIEANAAFTVANSGWNLANASVGFYDSTAPNFAVPTGNLMSPDESISGFNTIRGVDAFGVKLVPSYDCMDPMGSLVTKDLGSNSAI